MVVDKTGDNISSVFTAKLEDSDRPVFDTCPRSCRRNEPEVSTRSLLGSILIGAVPGMWVGLSFRSDGQLFPPPKHTSFRRFLT